MTQAVPSLAKQRTLVSSEELVALPVVRPKPAEAARAKPFDLDLLRAVSSNAANDIALWA